MISITPKALDKIRELNQWNQSLRIAILGGGCSGLSYSLGFEEGTQPTDTVLNLKGITVIIDKKSYLYLIGLELDYEGGLNGKGFTYNNPNSMGTCGCGTSFST